MREIHCDPFLPLKHTIEPTTLIRTEFTPDPKPAVVIDFEEHRRREQEKLQLRRYRLNHPRRPEPPCAA